MFSALRQGATLYILEKSEEPVVKTGYVESVTPPRYNPATGFLTVVDITVKIGGDKKDYIGVPSNQSTHQYGDIVISENRETMVSEIDSMLRNSKNIIESVDHHKKIVAACEKMLIELNPSYAKEQERDVAIEDLTAKVNGMESKFDSIENVLAKIEGLLTKAETN